MKIDRKNKQKNHQEMCIIISILDEGPDFRAKDGVEAIPIEGEC
jgi:hypothetical protein